MFTRDEFDIMVEELLHCKPASYNMLVTIAEKTLRGIVTKWCYNDPYLRGTDAANDIMQDLFLRLIQVTIPLFLLRSDDGEINDDPNGFKNWIFKIAYNLKKDYSNKVRKDAFNTTSDEEIVIEIPDGFVIEDEVIESDAVDVLRKAIDIVINLKSGIYKILTWLANSVFMLAYDITKIKATNMIEKIFSKMTLDEMYRALSGASVYIRWLTFTDSQNLRITTALSMPYDDEKTYGETTYESFYMKKGGKKSISDWINRINTTIKEEWENE